MILILKIALILFGIYLIAEYIPPLITKAVLDAGNAFGLSVGVLSIVAGIRLETLCGRITTLWQTGGKAPVIAVCAVLLLFAAFFLATLVRVVRFSEDNTAGQTTVIVLGCRVVGTAPSTALRKRTLVAAEYLKTHPDAVVIVSGGQGKDEGISEGECMKTILLGEGIEADRIFVEDKSTSTDENFAFSKRIIEENGLSDKVAIATHDYHQMRASMIAEKNGLTPASLPAPSERPSRATFFTREVFGIWVQWIKG